MPVGVSSSSVMVVVTLLAVLLRLGAGPPPPAGLERADRERLARSLVQRVVRGLDRERLEPAALCVKVRVPVLAV